MIPVVDPRAPLIEQRGWKSMPRQRRVLWLVGSLIISIISMALRRKFGLFPLPHR
jgi:hypothetical protein